MYWFFEASTLAQMGGTYSLVGMPQTWQGCTHMNDEIHFPDSTAVVQAYTEDFINSATPAIVAVNESPTASWMMAAKLVCTPPPPQEPLPPPPTTSITYSYSGASSHYATASYYTSY